jgi:hypothetical protein
MALDWQQSTSDQTAFAWKLVGLSTVNFIESNTLRKPFVKETVWTKTASSPQSRCNGAGIA